MFGQRVSVSELGEEGAVDATPPEALYQSRWEESLTGGGGGEEEEERNFCMLMESLGASNVFEE